MKQRPIHLACSTVIPLSSKDEINERNIENLGLDREDYDYQRVSATEVRYHMFLTEKSAKQIKALPYITSVEVNTRPSFTDDPGIFGHSKYREGN